MEKDHLSYAEISRIERRNAHVNAGVLLGVGAGVAAAVDGVFEPSLIRIGVGVPVAGVSAGIRYRVHIRNR